jgi:hypothetical protein
VRRLRPPDAHLIGSDRFFYSELTGTDRLRQEVFALGYHLHWGWAEAMGLEIDERRAFVRLLADVLAEQQAEAERSRS